MTPGKFFLAILLVFISWTTCGAFAIVLVYCLYLYKVINLQASVRTLKNILNLIPKQRVDEGGKPLDHSKAENYSTPDDLSSETELPTSNGNKLVSHSAIDDAVDNLRMHITVLNLLTWIVLLNAPSFIYWLKKLR
nr:PREDICTED: GPI inositol-deacylase-like [Latimeria chalumnae]|eukprot:XP_006014240.1 PREDICTED: GPI inositol-deacylase-like [Latimeria chalumnae]